MVPYYRCCPGDGSFIVCAKQKWLDCVLSSLACFFLNICYIAWIDTEFKEMDEYSTLQIDLNTT